MFDIQKLLGQECVNWRTDFAGAVLMPQAVADSN